MFNFIDIQNRIVELLDGITFVNDRLEAWKTIYPSPAVLTGPATQPFEIQVIWGGGEYSEQDGGIIHGDWYILIALLYRTRIDYGGRRAKALRDTTKSLFVVQKQIIDALQGSYLPSSKGVALLTRPLTIRSDSRFMHHPVSKPGLLIKEMAFAGGINDTW